jgi:hypothetical protein
MKMGSMRLRFVGYRQRHVEPASRIRAGVLDFEDLLSPASMVVSNDRAILRVRLVAGISRQVLTGVAVWFVVCVVWEQRLLR